MGVIPWKHGFSADIETYRCRSRMKAEHEDKMRVLKERVASIEGAMAASQQQQPKARLVAHLETSPGSQRHSSVASTEHPAADRVKMVADNPQHYPRRRHQREDPHGIAEVPTQGGTIHGMPIHEGYASHG